MPIRRVSAGRRVQNDWMSNPDNASLHGDLRMAYRTIAEYIDTVLPEGREKSLALTELENSSMWAHKAIEAR